MFIDETVVDLLAGDGGDGCFSYARAKYKPKGKPNGGSGGRGGSIFFEASTRVQTLQDVAIRRIIRGNRGGHGLGSSCYGRKGADITVYVPVGTVVRDDETGDIIHDFTDVGERAVIAKGGRGGRGNEALSNRFNLNPEMAEAGKPGQKLTVKITLKVMADVGLVGKPNAGKSTLLSVISHAHPKIADYPFTTLEPQLGIVKISEAYDSFVVADIPGIIEGAHDGKGLGHRFLRHIERTRILSIMVDAASEDPLMEAQLLIDELRLYSPFLAEKPKVFVLTKTDAVDPENLVIPDGWLSISSATGDGVNDLLQEYYRILKDLRLEDEGAERPPISVG